MITILITHHSEKNRKYLDLCLKSIFYQSFKDIEIIVATSYELKDLDKRVSIVMNMPNTTYGQKINAMAKAASGSHLLITQDDVVLTRLTLKNMMHILGSQKAIINPLSNCDLDWKYNIGFDVMLKNAYIKLGRPMTIENFGGLEEYLFDYQPTNFQMAIITDWVACYCTLMPKDIFDELGGYDLEYKNGFEDADLCYRAKELKVNCFICVDAFALHFSGATTSSMNLEQTANRKRFSDRWGKDPA